MRSAAAGRVPPDMYMCASPPRTSAPCDDEQGDEGAEARDVQGEHGPGDVRSHPLVIHGKVDEHPQEALDEEEGAEGDEPEGEGGPDRPGVARVDGDECGQQNGARRRDRDVRRPQGSQVHAIPSILGSISYLLFPDSAVHATPNLLEVLEMDLETRGERVEGRVSGFSLEHHAFVLPQHVKVVAHGLVVQAQDRGEVVRVPRTVAEGMEDPRAIRPAAGARDEIPQPLVHGSPDPSEPCTVTHATPARP